jgi:polar amino acid transport system substrate-binding protein
MRRAITALALLGLTATAHAQTPDTLRVGIDPAAAPFAMAKLSGGVEGFLIDLFAALGDELGKKLEITEMQYSGLFPAMQAGNIDFVGAPVTATALRAESMIFSEGYLNTDYQFVSLKDGPDLNELDAFRGLTISVNKGSAYDAWAREKAAETGWTVTSYGTTNDAISAVLSGRSAAALTNNTEVAWASKKNPRLKPGYRYSTGDVFTMSFPKQATDLRNEVEAALECLKTKGEVAKIYEEWFGQPAEEGSAVTTVAAGFGVEGFDGYDAQQHEPACKE